MISYGCGHDGKIHRENVQRPYQAPQRECSHCHQMRNVDDFAFVEGLRHVRETICKYCKGEGKC